MTDHRTNHKTIEDKIGDFIYANGKTLLIILAVVIVAGGAFVVIKNLNESKQKAALDELYKIEKPYLEKRIDFDAAEASEKIPEKDKKPEDKKLVKKTGELEKDYPEFPGKAEAFITENLGSTASELAAVNLAKLYLEYSKSDKAVSILEPVYNAQNSKTQLMGSVVATMLATAQTNVGNYDAAENILSKIVQNKKENAFKALALYKSGHILMKKNDLDKALSMFQSIKDDYKESQYGKEADKFIRYIEAIKKKN